MNRIRSLALPIAATLAAGALTALAAGPAQAADINVARNGGFESGLSDWTCSGGSGAAVPSPVYAGSGALRATPAGQDNAQCSQTVTVKPNSTYTLGAQVQGSYVYLGATGTGTQDVSTWTPGSGGGWQKLSTTFTTGPNTTRVTVWTHGWYGQPAYVVDEFSVFGPDGAAAPTPARASPATPRRPRFPARATARSPFRGTRSAGRAAITSIRTVPASRRSPPPPRRSPGSPPPPRTPSR